MDGYTPSKIQLQTANCKNSVGVEHELSLQTGSFLFRLGCGAEAIGCVSAE